MEMYGTWLVKNVICGEMGICGLGAAQATSTGKLADSAKIGRNASTICLIEPKTQEEMQQDPEGGNRKLTVILNRNGAQHTEGEYISLDFQGDYIQYNEARSQPKPEMPY